MTLRERIGVDVGDQPSIEWARANDVPHIDVNPDHELSGGFSAATVAAVREARSDVGVSLGLHTLSAAIERLQRRVEDAAGSDATILLENLNPEPAEAEVQYVPTTPAECRRFFDALPDDSVGWACNPPHANLLPTGIHGFLDEMDLARCGEVRLNDNRGTHEEHLLPGEGTIDFERLFARFEDVGYDGPYIVAQDDPDAGLEARERLLELIER